MTIPFHRIPATNRFAVAIAAILIPLALLAFGVYGTFSFTFSIPLIWQFCFLGEGINSLGLKRRSFWPSAATGILTGIVLAVSGGFILKALGMTGYSLDKVHELNSFLRSFGIKITFMGEAGFKLLSAGNELNWVLLSLIYCVLLVGLGEEIFWRGFIQRKISRTLPVPASIWVTAVLFALVHSYLFFIIPFKEGLIFLGLITLAGAFWGYLYEYFGNIWGPAFSHGIIAFIVWRYFVFSTV